jgi:murein hydrolase activator
MLRVDDVPGGIFVVATHVENQGAAVGEANRLGGCDHERAAGTLADLDHDRKNGENRRCGDQERMIGGVFEESIHCSLSMSGDSAGCAVARGRPKKGAKYSSALVRDTATGPGCLTVTVSNSPRRPSRWAKTLCVLSLCLTAFPAPAAGVDAKEAELKQVRNRIESIRRAIHADAERRDALAGQLKDADLEIQSARERLAAVRARRMASQARLDDLQSERSDTQRQIDAQRGELAAELKVAYMNGRQEQLKLLLNQRDPAQLGRMMAFYGYFGRARAERITAVSEHLEHLDLLAESIAAETFRLQEIEQDNARDVRALAAARARRVQTLASVQSKLKNRNDELARLQREATALEKLVAELRRAIEEFPELAEQPFQRVKGRLPWPAKGNVLARFGQLRAGGPLRWQGVVIAAERGTQVRAPFHGRVVYADWLPGLGLLVVLDHGGGYMTLYGYNEQLYRRVGERVAPGDVIAAVGDAAGVGKTGLYLEIRKGKQAIDPLSWLVRR